MAEPQDFVNMFKEGDIFENSKDFMDLVDKYEKLSGYELSTGSTPRTKTYTKDKALLTYLSTLDNKQKDDFCTRYFYKELEMLCNSQKPRM